MLRGLYIDLLGLASSEDLFLVVTLDFYFKKSYGLIKPFFLGPVFLDLLLVSFSLVSRCLVLADILCHSCLAFPRFSFVSPNSI